MYKQNITNNSRDSKGPESNRNENRSTPPPVKQNEDYRLPDGRHIVIR